MKGFHKSSQIITKLIHNDLLRYYPTIELYDTSLGCKVLHHFAYCNLQHKEFDHCGGYIP